MLLLEYFISRALPVERNFPLHLVDHIDRLVLVHKHEIHLRVRRLLLPHCRLLHHDLELPSIVLVQGGGSDFIVVTRGCLVPCIEVDGADSALP